ncbi:gamma-glutamylcyclotransferase family protein [Paenibacillus sp. YIM B09110]|uniref:gamma-glutamylcyclotransferase family protein n=1 Tax=Paenibacillus sp. YIM B09110 TaxID=3126102 RepID=UPI00301C3A94
MSIQVFIYGTLLPGESNHHVVASFIQASRTGHVFGRLVDCGSYPAAVRDADAKERNSIIRGQWIVVDRAGLASMDELEEFYGIEERNDYERVWVRDAYRPELAGWIYVWSNDRGCPRIQEAYWPDYRAGV